MRIAFISHEFPPDTGKGGIGTYVKQIATAMAGKGIDVHVFAGSPYKTGSVILDGIQLHLVQCENGLDFREKVLPVFAEQQQLFPFDVMESPEIGGNAWEIKKQYPQLPLLVRLHAPDYLVESLKKRYIPFFAKLRFVLGAFRRLTWDMGYWRMYNKEQDADYQFILLANYISAPSEAMKNWVLQNWHIPASKIKIIPNFFLPAPAFVQIPIAEKNSYKRIVFFGRLNVLKGLVNASIAMKKILQLNPDWQFRVIGDDGNGPYAGTSMRNWMKQELKTVLKQVEFMDGMAYELLPASIAQAEIVLLPSLFESFSYTCAEAMAAGKAIVGSKNGGMADLLVDDESGLLVDPENVADIYNAIKKLMEDYESRYQISINARHRILTEFNTELITHKCIAYYKAIARL